MVYLHGYPSPAPPRRFMSRTPPFSTQEAAQVKVVVPSAQLRLQTVVLWLFFLGFFNRVFHGQVMTPSLATQTPLPNAGHNYIEDAIEVINPANGSVSLRLQVPVAKERALNFPLYAFRYDSATQFEMGFRPQEGESRGCSVSNQVDGDITPCVTEVFGPYRQSVFNTSGSAIGSTFTLFGPNTYAYSQHSVTIQPNSGQPITCVYNTGYVYEDYSGEIHTLGGVNSNSTGVPSTHDCNVGYFSVPAQPLAGDETIKMVADGVNALPRFTDLSGTTAIPPVGDSLSYDLFGGFQVEDSNGNQRASTGRSGTYVGFDPGHPSKNPTLYFPGLAAPYVYTTKQLRATYNPTSGPNIGTPSGSNSFCTGSGPDSAYLTLVEVVTKLQLPDGRAYLFDYDPKFGLLSKITYPSGAWARYTWAAIPNAQGIGYEMPPDNFYSINGATSHQRPNNTGTQCGYVFDYPAIVKREVSVDGQNIAVEQDFDYRTAWVPSSPTQWSSKSTSVITKDLLRTGTPSFETVYNYLPLHITPTYGDPATYSPNTLEDTIVTKDFDGHMLTTSVKRWDSSNRLAGECTILDDGSISGTFYSYKSYYWDQNGFTVGGSGELWNQTNLRTNIASFDYGTLDATCIKPTALPDREIQIDYAIFPNTAKWPTFTLTANNDNSGKVWSPAAITDRISVMRTYERGTLVAQTNYNYDETPLQAVQAPLGHDEQLYSSTSKESRGNLTSIKHMCFGNTQACASSTTRAGYDSTGQVVAETDSNQNTTTFSYTDNFVSPSRGQTNSLLTHMSLPQVGSTVNEVFYSYDFSGGTLHSTTDANKKVTSYEHNDVWNRLTDSHMPDGGSTASRFFDIGSNPSVVSTVQMDGVNQLRDTTTMDGFGRIILSRRDDPLGTVFVDNTYDGLGRVWSKSNPYRTAGKVTPDVTSNEYDALGRLRLRILPDLNQTRQEFLGPIEVSTNELKHPWRRTYDAIGHLGSVQEPNGNLTKYSYDGLGNLSGVDQGGSSGEISRVRSFTYDSLSRLTSATNPETGKVSYAYDNGGTLCSGDIAAPCSKTDVRGVTTTYSYDSLNRLTGRFSIAANPVKTPGSVSAGKSSCFMYDHGTGTNIDNGVGRLTAEWTQLGPCPVGAVSIPTNALSYRLMGGYDPLGRLTSETSCALAPCALEDLTTMVYTYDFAGNQTGTNSGIMSGSSLAAGLAWSTGFDAAGRPNQVKASFADASHPDLLFQANEQTLQALGVPYGPFGILNAQYGLQSSASSQQAVLSESRGYDNRMRLVSKTVTGNPASAGAPPSSPTGPTVAAGPTLHVASSVSFGAMVPITLTVGCSSKCGAGDIFIDGQNFQGGRLSDGGTITFAERTTNLELGAHQVTGDYSSEDGSTHTTLDPVTFQIVAPAATDIPVTISLNSTDLAAGLITASASKGYEDGQIVGYWSLDNQPGVYFTAFGSDLQSFPLGSGLSPGAHQIDVLYYGSPKYASSSARLVFNTGSGSPTLAMSPSPIHVNGTALLTFSVPCATQCGSLSFTVDGANWRGSGVSDGGSIILSLGERYFAAGTHVIAMTYGGNLNSPSGDLPPLSFDTNTPAALSVQPVMSPSGETTVAAGQSIVLSATQGYYNGPTSGTRFLDGMYAGGFSVQDNNPMMYQLPTNLSIGDHHYEVHYGGTASYQSSQNGVTIHVQ